MGVVTALRSWISPGSAACRTFHTCGILLQDPIKFQEEVWIKVSSLCVAELLKVFSALLVWVIPTSPSTRAVRSAISQDSRSDSEQSMDKELFYIPFSISSTDWCPRSSVICMIQVGFGLAVVTKLKQTERKRILFVKKAPEVLCPVFFCWHFHVYKTSQFILLIPRNHQETEIPGKTVCHESR